MQQELDLSLVLARLQSLVPAFTLVEFDDYLDGGNTVTAPTALIAPFKDVAEENPNGTGFIDQHTTQQFAVWIYCARADLRTLKHAVREALLGWTPDGDFTPVELASGERNSLDNSRRWWREIYFTTYHTRA